MDIEDQRKPTTPSGHENLEVHVCHRCRWPFPKPNPSVKRRRSHNRICGTIDGFDNIIDSKANSDDDDHHSDSDSDSDVQEKDKTPSHEVHICLKCGWPFPKPNPSFKHRRAHKRICGSIEGYTKLIINSDTVSDDENQSDSDDEQQEDKTPSSKIEKKIINESSSSVGKTEEKSVRSEEDMCSALTQFSDTRISPDVTSEFKKAVKFEEHDRNTKRSVPLVKDTDGSHNKDQVENVHKLSEPIDIPIVDKVETMMEDFKDKKTSHSNAYRGDKQAENISVVDMFEVKTVHERVHERQTSEHERVQEPKSGKLLTGVDASFKWSNSSLDGNWGSVSGLSDVFGKSELSDDKSRLGRSDAFEGGSLVKSDQEIIEQKASEIKTNEEAITKVNNWSTSEAKSSDPKRLSNLIKKIEDTAINSEGQKSNLTQETPKVNQERSNLTPKTVKVNHKRSNSQGNPKVNHGRSNLTQEAPKVNQERSNLTQETVNVNHKRSNSQGNPKVNQGRSTLTKETVKVNKESSAVTVTDEGKKVEKKSKGLPSWMKFLCCSMSTER